MAINTYDIGDTVHIPGTFTNSAGNAADPTTVVLKIINPYSVITTYTYGTDVQLVKDSVGTYHVDYVPDTGGMWEYRWEATGAIVTAGETQFYVNRSAFQSQAGASTPSVFATQSALSSEIARAQAAESTLTSSVSTNTTNIATNTANITTNTTNITDLQASTVQTSELTVQHAYIGVITTNTSVPMFIAPFACTITWASVALWTQPVAASDVNYWTVNLRRIRTTANQNAIATKTTRVSGGEAMQQRVGWNFDGVPFDPTYQVLAKGDTVDFLFTKTGGPADITNALVAIRYEPV